MTCLFKIQVIILQVMEVIEIGRSLAESARFPLFGTGSTWASFQDYDNISVIKEIII